MRCVISAYNCKVLEAWKRIRFLRFFILTYRKVLTKGLSGVARASFTSHLENMNTPRGKETKGPASPMKKRKPSCLCQKRPDLPTAKENS